MIDGPRSVRPNEMEALRALTDVVFRPNMPEQYPQLFNLDNVANLCVCFDGAKCVSHVGMTQRDALLMGCAVRVCCIGAVSTHPDYRKQGLASLCFDYAVSKAGEDGVDFMIVSGSRGLYSRNGCLHVGRDYKLSVTIDSFMTTAYRHYGVHVNPVPADEMNLVAECYRREPVRFVRPPDDYNYLLQSGYAMNSPSIVLGIHPPGAAGVLLGYLILRMAEPGQTTSIIEFAGDRRAALSALPEVIRRYSLGGLNLQIMRSDGPMLRLCAEAGFTMQPTPASGTVKLINFPQLMQRMHQRFVELLGETSASLLRFEQDGEEYRFALGSDVLTADRDLATRIVFGDPDGIPAELVEASGSLGQTLRAILPLPTLYYGINYV